MIHLDDERLVDLALGTTAESAEDAHISGCATCAACLTSLAETIALTRGSGETVLVDPPPRVWDSIQAELRSDSSSATVTSLESRRERRARRPRSGLPTAWLVAAASVLGVVLGVGGTTLANRVGGEPQPADFTVASASLAPLDSPQAQGVASLVDRDGGLHLTLPALELDPGDGYLEVWLINRDLARMISVGVIPNDATDVVLPISQQLIDEGYVIVDISREPFDDQPAHSGHTLVRGELDGLDA
ncbi:MAG: anti-sigma factor [Dermatophilaceae bacterium]